MLIFFSSFISNFRLDTDDMIVHSFTNWVGQKTGPFLKIFKLVYMMAQKGEMFTTLSGVILLS